MNFDAERWAGSEVIQGSAMANWPLEKFDRFTRIEVGNTPEPWLNILGNGLFGGHLILLLSNRGDGREFRVDTSQNTITNTDLHFTGLDELTKATHGIGYSVFTFGGKPKAAVRVTYFSKRTAKMLKYGW